MTVYERTYEGLCAFQRSPEAQQLLRQGWSFVSSGWSLGRYATSERTGHEWQLIVSSLPSGEYGWAIRDEQSPFTFADAQGVGEASIGDAVDKLEAALAEPGAFSG